MICLSCGHYSAADREMAREQGSDACKCKCHKPAPRRYPFVPSAQRQAGEPLPFQILGWTVGDDGAVTVHFASGKSAPATEHPTVAHLRADRRVREVA